MTNQAEDTPVWWAGTPTAEETKDVWLRAYCAHLTSGANSVCADTGKSIQSRHIADTAVNAFIARHQGAR